MYKAKKFISYMALCVLIFSLCACGEKGSENAAIYGETVGGLEDNELFAIIDTNASLPVLLVTSQVYNDGLGNQAALNCDVYYLIDKEVKNIGTIESMGTAYPIAYDETGIYAASGHDMQRFEIEKSGSLRLAEGIYEQFDESGNAAYTMKKGEETDVITEEEYYAAFEKYSNAIRENTSTVLEKRKNDWRIDMELTINDLSKEYGRKKAVNHFSAKLTNGVYGLIGANGAGKTTLMRIICDVQTETKGAIFFNGKNIHDLGEKYRNILGYLPQNFGYYPNFTAYKFLMYISAIKGLPPKKAHNRTMELLQVVDLLTQKNEKIKTFSGGMKQRLGIAQALLNDPRILILDEPTAGLDPKERVRFRNLISSLAENRLVILSTHIVSDVEYIANEILIMKNGELIQHGSPEEILKPIEKCVWECDVSRKEVEELELNYVTANLKHNNGAERLRIISQEAPCRTAWNVDPTLEDLYLYYFAEVSEHE